MSKNKEHNPFFIRNCIVGLSIAIGVIFDHLFDSSLIGIVGYLVSVTALDQLCAFAKMKSSNYANPKTLLSKEKITPADLDIYYEAKRKIRLYSLAAAVLSQLFFFSAVFFVAAFAIASIVGHLYVHYRLGIVGPKLVQDLSNKEILEMRKRSDQSNQDVSLGIATGLGPNGFLKPNSEYSYSQPIDHSTPSIPTSSPFSSSSNSLF